MGLSRQNVLIVGGSGGLGMELAKTFYEKRDRLALHYFRSGKKAKLLMNELGHSSESDDAFTCQADLRQAHSVDTLFNLIKKRWSHLDVLIHSGGLNEDALFSKISETDWNETVKINLTGVFLCMKLAAGWMMAQKKGHIINIASRSGMTGRIGQASYAASKAGVIGLTKAASLEWGMDQIQVNAVLPGYLPTPMGLKLSLRHQQKIVLENSLHKSSSLKEVAQFIFNLSRMENVSGQVFNLDSRLI